MHALLNDTTAPGSSFPSEEVALNFPNNADVQTLSSLLIEGYETAAIQLSTNAVKDIPKLLGCDPKTKGEDPCVQSFIASFGLKAYRRPLTTRRSARIDRAIFRRARSPSALLPRFG